MIKLVLASQSPSRKAILERLCINFDAYTPDIPEAPFPSEAPQSYVQRLSYEKAEKVCSMIAPSDYQDYKDVWVLGNDQTAVCDNKIYEKPETLENGLAFFRDFSGKTVVYYSGITLMSYKTRRFQTSVHASEIHFPILKEEEVLRYFQLCPQALQCASGLKIEGPGALLVDSTTITDYYAGPGLPISVLKRFVEAWGLSLFDFCTTKESATV